MANSNQPDATPIAGSAVVSPAPARMRPSAKETREFVRFTRHERTTHGIMIVSFIALALTGLTLKFSYTTWAANVSVFLGGFQSCGFRITLRRRSSVTRARECSESTTSISI